MIKDLAKASFPIGGADACTRAPATMTIIATIITTAMRGRGGCG